MNRGRPCNAAYTNNLPWMITQGHCNQELLKSEEIRKTKLWPQLLPIENKRELMQHKGTPTSKIREKMLCLGSVNQKQSFCISSICIKCSPDEQRMAYVLPRNTSKLLGEEQVVPWKGFRCWPCQRQHHWFITAVLIYLYLGNTSLPYYINCIFKSVLFPRVGIQELFHAFSTSASAAKYPKKGQRCQRLFQ